MIRVLLVAPGRERLARVDALLRGDQQVAVVARATRLHAILDGPREADVAVIATDDPAALLLLLVNAEEGDGVIPPLVVLAPSSRHAATAELLRRGVRALLPPHAEARALSAAIEAAAVGLTSLSSEVVADLVNARTRAPVPVSAPSVGGLSPRESQILGLVAEGLGNKLVAARLGISEHTVKTHIASIFEKLGAETRAEAVALGARTGALLL